MEVLNGITTAIVLIAGVSTKVVTGGVPFMEVKCTTQVQEVKLGDQCTTVACDKCTNGMATWDVPPCRTKTAACVQPKK